MTNMTNQSEVQVKVLTVYRDNFADTLSVTSKGTMAHAANECC